jgi:hypothetical protein
MANMVATTPASFTLAVRTYLSIAYANKMLAVLLLIFAGFTVESNSQGFINCDGTLNCNQTGDWVTVTNANFFYDPCTISINFRYTKCCNITCNYIIDIQQIATVGVDNNAPCVFPTSSIVNEAIKLALATLNQKENLPVIGPPFEVSVKTPSCYTEIPQPGMPGIEVFDPCTPQCCVTRYIISKDADWLVIQSDISDYDGSVVANCTVPCQTICAMGHPLAPSEPYYLHFDDYTSDVNCAAPCFWRLEGNGNVSENDFIGPTNGQDFVVKTKNTEAVVPSVMERIRVHNNSKIDFKLNSWYSMPQITFDADPWSSDPNSRHADPTIKIYRPNGYDVNGVYNAFPWWLSVNVKNGTNEHGGAGAFNIWSADNAQPLVGQEDANMVKRFSILQNGNVGIGVEEPRQKLVVDGTICATEVRVSLSGEPCWWPDYVFNSNYKLRDILELESYIKNNKHLPDIPTAEEVNNSGVELGDMQVRMLKKIEELTLYIIELKKENEEIKKLVNNKKE